MSTSNNALNFSFPSLVNVELHIGKSMIHRCYSFKAKKQISNINLNIRIHLTKNDKKMDEKWKQKFIARRFKTENTISSDELAL